MKRIYFTVTGTKYYFGQEFIEPGMRVKLIKDTENQFDSEAIKVEMRGLGTVGYVANSTTTVLGEGMSAGRIYDKMADSAYATVLYVLPKGVQCFLEQPSISEKRVTEYRRRR